MSQKAPSEASVRRKLSESIKEQVMTLGRYSTVHLVALGTLEIRTGLRELGCVYTPSQNCLEAALRMVAHQFPSSPSAVGTR